MGPVLQVRPMQPQAPSSAFPVEPSVVQNLIPPSRNNKSQDSSKLSNLDKFKTFMKTNQDQHVELNRLNS